MTSFVFCIDFVILGIRFLLYCYILADLYDMLVKSNIDVLRSFHGYIRDQHEKSI